MAYVCLCNRVSERKVRRSIAHGALSVDEVGEACGAGTTCHGCHPTIEDLLDESVVETAVPVPRLAPSL